PLAAWFAVVVALGLGLAIGIVFFGKRKEPEKIIQYVTVPASAAVAASPEVTGDIPAPEKAVAAAETKKPAPGVQGARPAGPAPATNAKEPEKAPVEGLKGLSGLSAAGPNGPTGSGASAPAGGAQLESDQVQSTVARYTGSVKRACWQPA